MPIKEHEYVKQTLERYTNCRIEDFCDHIVITNFKKYIMRFKEKTNGAYAEGNFRIVNAKDINCTMIEFGIGSPQAALVINCLAYLDNLKTVIMLGMCGGIDDVLEEGDFIVPSGTFIIFPISCIEKPSTSFSRSRVLSFSEIEKRRSTISCLDSSWRIRSTGSGGTGSGRVAALCAILLCRSFFLIKSMALFRVNRKR